MHAFDEYVSHIRRQKIDALINVLEQQLQGTDVRAQQQTLISELGFWRTFR